MFSAEINDNHCVCILAALAKDVMVAKAEESQKAKTCQSNDDPVQNKTFETLASILRQCEPRHNGQQSSGRSLIANQGKFGRRKGANSSNGFG